MKIVIDYPPNMQLLSSKFVIPKGTCFTYGDTLYNPDNGPISEAFLAHEETHSRQQEKIEPETWWKLYLNSDDFRLSQEIEAYQTQYRVMKEHVKDRNSQSRYLDLLAKDLASPLYGSIISFSDARQAIKSDRKIEFDLTNIVANI